MTHPRPAAALLAALALPTLASCTDSSAGRSTAADDRRTITVTSTNDACELSAHRAPAGRLVYKLTNGGDKVTEFYLYGEDGRRVVGELENVGPGISRDLVVTVPAGDYVAACKPGMTGSGIRSGFTVE